MSDHLTLKNLRKLLPREAYERVAAADIAYRLSGTEHNIGEYDKRVEETKFQNWCTKAGIEQAEKFGLTKLKAEYWECHDELVPQLFCTIKVCRDPDHRNGRGKLAHFYFNGAYGRINYSEAPLGVNSLIIPKANIHLVGAVWAEALHQLKHLYDKWKSHSDRERCRKRAQARRKFVRRIANVLTTRESKALEFWSDGSEITDLTNETQTNVRVSDGYRRSEFNQNRYDERVDKFDIRENGHGIEVCCNLRLKLAKSYDRKVWRELSALIRRTGLLNNGKEVTK